MTTAKEALIALVRLIDGALWAFVRFGRGIVISIGALSACLAVVVGLATWEATLTLPSSHLDMIDGREHGSVTVLDREGALLGVRGERFHLLTMEEAGPTLVDAILSTEDRRFFWHLGVDPIGLTRAILVNWRAGRTEQGGSSITQQVAKLAFLSNERRLSRKLREAPLALALEWRFTKREILEIYLNRAYLGGGAFGFRAAAKFYFDKEPAALNKAEAALLAGLLRAPSKWSPLSDFPAAQDRARVVVDAMRDAEALTEGERQEAYASIAALTPPVVHEQASFFVDWIDQQIPPHLWTEASDLEVVTTLDRGAQAHVEQAMQSVFESDLVTKRDKDAEAAMVVLSRDGALRAMVGGRDYWRSQFNRASASARQLGSAFKPVVFAAALGAGVPPNAYVLDQPIAIGSWRPENYSHQYSGNIPLVVALAKSSNMASVRLSQRAGIKNVVETAHRLGFSGAVPAYPSLALGTVETNPLEVASAYATIANAGRITPAFGVVEIRDRDSKKVLWRRKAPPARQAIPAAHAEYLTGMLRAVVEHGTGRRAALEGRDVAGKTGTTQEYRDAWFAGFSGNYVAAVWMGKDDFSKTNKVTGGRVPAQIWHDALAPLHDQNAPVVALKERVMEGYGPTLFEDPGESRARVAASSRRSALQTATRVDRFRASRQAEQEAARERLREWRDRRRRWRD